MKIADPSPLPPRISAQNLYVRPFLIQDTLRCQTIAAKAAMSSYAPGLPELAGMFHEERPLEPADERLVAILGTEVAGFIDLIGNHVSNLFVCPTVQGIGVGSALIAKAAELRPGRLTLSVFTVNPRARMFYERLGFKVVTTRAVPFGGKAVDVWCMARPAAACGVPMLPSRSTRAWDLSIDLAGDPGGEKAAIVASARTSKSASSRGSSGALTRPAVAPRPVNHAQAIGEGALRISKIGPSNRDEVWDLLEGLWGGSVMVIQDKVIRFADLDGFVAETSEGLAGIVTYTTVPPVEIVSINAFRSRLGIGSELVNRVEDVARQLGISRIQAVTTNDNFCAVNFFRKGGFEISRVDLGAVERARRIKPGIPILSADGIPIRDEIIMVKRI